MIRITEPRPVPVRALGLSLLALAVPAAGAMFAPEWMSEEQGVLLWLTIFIPPFLLTFYRGWQGASVGLASGMALLVLVHLTWVILAVDLPGYDVLLWITASYVGVCVGLGFFAELLRRERRAAEAMALTDSLTGLPNRRHAQIFLEAAFAAATRGRPLTVVMFDLDRFKILNDRYGHAAGDEVLRRIGPLLLRLTRRMDVCARWGGEEFLAVLSNCDARGGLAFAERVREDLLAEAFPWGAVTASAGVAEYQAGMGTPELLLAAADQALYRAKSEGRDRCALWTSNGGVLEEEPVSDETGGVGSDSGEGSGAQRRAESASAAEGVPGGTERLVVVDDDESVRRGLSRLLARLGYEVTEFPDGKSALEAMRAGEPADLVLTDLIMPEMSGFTLAECIEEEMGPHRILYMSAYSQERVSWRGAPGSVVGFVSKPMMAGELATRIRVLLDRPLSDGAEDAEAGERVDVALEPIPPGPTDT